MNKQKNILIRIPQATYDAIKVRAYYEGQTMSAVIRNAIAEYIKPEKKEGRS